MVASVIAAKPSSAADPIGITIRFFNLHYEVYRLFPAVIAIVAIGGFFVFLHHTKFGTWMRAVRQDKDMAIAMGVPANGAFAVTFALGTSLAMFGGVVSAPITSVEFRLGLDVLPLCFMAVIIGGLGNLPGTAAAGTAVGDGGRYHQFRCPNDRAPSLRRYFLAWAAGRN